MSQYSRTFKFLLISVLVGALVVDAVGIITEEPPQEKELTIEQDVEKMIELQEERESNRVNNLEENYSRIQTYNSNDWENR